MGQDKSHNNIKEKSKCPFPGGKTIRDWWPNQLKLNILRQHSSLSNPMGEDLTMLRNSRLLISRQLKKISSN